MQPEYLNLSLPWINELLVLIFFIISITDFFDGLLARKLNQISAFGTFLDPVADKLIVCAALIMLAAHHQTWLITVPTIIIISREILISALREWMAEINKKTNMMVSFMAQVKTFMQLLAICFILLNKDIFGINSVFEIGIPILFLATAITLWSGFNYLVKALKTFDS